MFLHGVAQVVLDIEGNTATAVAAEVGAHEGHDTEAQQHDQPRSERRGVPHDDVVDDLALNKGHYDLGDAAEDGTAESDEEIALIDKHVAAQTPHPAGALFASGRPCRL